MGIVNVNKVITSSKGELLKIGDAAKILHVSEQTLRDWTDQDKITAYVSEGGHRKYYEADVHRLNYESKQIDGFHRLSGIIVFFSDGTTKFESNTYGDYPDLENLKWGKYWDYKNGLEKNAHEIALTGKPVIDVDAEPYSDGGENISIGFSVSSFTEQEVRDLMPIVAEQVKQDILARYSRVQVVRWIDNQSGNLVFMG